MERTAGDVVVMLASRRAEVEQLARLLDGDLPPDDARSQVRRLATLASTVTREVDRPVLDEAARDRLRQRVMFEVQVGLAEAEAPARPPAERTRSTRTAVASGLASLLVATTGVAVAAQEALPGDPLYGIKRVTESVRMAVAGDAVERGRLELALASERLNEVTTSTARGGALPSHLVDTLAAMDTRTVAGVETLARVAEQTDDPDLIVELVTFIDRQTSGLVDVYGDLPVTVRPHAEDSLTTLRRLHERWIDPLVAGCELCPADLVAAGLGTSPLVSSSLPPATAGTDDADTSTRSDGDADEGAATSDGDGGQLDDTVSDLERATDTSQPRSIVPTLPGPLDDVGSAVERSIGSVVDGASKLLDDTGDAVEDTVDDLGDTVDDLGDTADGLLGGATGTTGGLLDP